MSAGTTTSFKCSCGNEGWIGAGDITSPCICGNVYYGEEYKTKVGLTIIKAKLLQDDINELIQPSIPLWKRIYAYIRSKIKFM